MKLVEHKSYEGYVKAQRRSHHRKRNNVWATSCEIDAIAAWHSQKKLAVGSILCHGVRTGWEVESLQQCFPGSVATGTDLFEAPGVVEHDFHEIKEGWLGAFDLLYSNSLDHSYDPAKALDTWAAQLAPNGRMCIEWSKWHQHTNRADCFGATFAEYIALMNGECQVEDVLQCGGKDSKKCSIIIGRLASKETRHGVA